PCSDGSRERCRCARKASCTCCRSLIEIDQPVSPPADWQKPGACADHACRCARGVLQAAKPIKPWRRRARVDAGRAGGMLPKVLQDIDERVAHLAWRAKRTCVVAIVPDATAPFQHAVHGARQANRKAPDAARQRFTIRGLDEQVQVIGLDGEVSDATSSTLAV